MCQKDPNCRICGPDGCSQACGKCQDFQRITVANEKAFVEGRKVLGENVPIPTRFSPKEELQKLTWEFDDTGDNCRGRYLHLIHNVAATSNALSKASRRSWYDAMRITKTLESEGLIYNTSTGVTARYALTKVGDGMMNEYKRQEDGMREDAEAGQTSADAKQARDRKGQSESVTSQGVPDTSPETRRTDQENSNKESVDREKLTGLAHKIRNADDIPKPPPLDPYQKAYLDILTERYGDQVTFRDVQERVLANA